LGRHQPVARKNEEGTMANEFSSVLEEFSRLAMNYCENAKKFMPTSDHVRLVEVYQTGLAAMLEGTWTRFREIYASTSEGHREEIDAFVKMTGMIPMLKAANNFIGAHTSSADALHAGASIFDKPKSMIKEIPGWLPIVGWAGPVLRLIDEVITNIRDLIPTSGSPSTGQPTGGVFDPSVRNSSLVSCRPFTFPVPDGPRDVNIEYTKATRTGESKPLAEGDMPDIEIEANGQKQPSLTGKNKSAVLKDCNTFTLHLKGDPEAFYAQIQFKYSAKK
jgi:hypothetical protein